MARRGRHSAIRARIATSLRRADRDPEGIPKARVSTYIRPALNNTGKSPDSQMTAFSLRNLLDRRVPQITGIYLGVSWGVVEFVDWLVNRYLLSPHLTDLALVTLGSLVPSVLLLAYFHGKPGRDRWTLVEKVGVSANLVIVTVLLLLVFGPKDLGSTTTAITLEDESGAIVERVVPKGTFRKRIALFFFDNVSADTALDWLQYGLPSAVEDDLIQDLFIDCKTYYPWFGEDLRRAGHPDGLDLPLTLRRRIAQDHHVGHFISGTIDGRPDSLIVTVALHETERGNLVVERTYSGADVFALADSISLRLRHDLEIPTRHIEETADLPVAETLTRSMEAYRRFIEGYRAFVVDEDYPASARHFEAAVAVDPSFAYAHTFHYLVRLLLNETEGAQASLSAAMEHLYRLPERIQFGVKSEYYWWVKQDIEKAIAVAGMFTELFPRDILGYRLMGSYYLVANRRDKAIEVFEQILAIDSSQVDYIRTVGALYEREGEFQRALQYYELYADRFPDDPQSFRWLGELERTLGNHDEARAQYERALVLEPDDPSTLIALGGIAADVGDYERAETAFEEALDAAETPAQKMAVYSALQSYYRRRGQMRRALEMQRLDWSEAEGNLPPLSLAQRKLQNLGLLARAGQPGAAQALLDSISAALSPPLDRLAALGQLQVASASDDADRLQQAADAIEELIAELGLEVFRPLVVRARGRVLELTGECEAAIDRYEQLLEMEPAQVYRNLDIGRCYRKLDRPDEALDHLQVALRVHPANPSINYQMALAHRDLGNTDLARQHVDAALDAWSDADPSFEPAADARRLRDELGG